MNKDVKTHFIATSKPAPRVDAKTFKRAFEKQSWKDLATYEELMNQWRAVNFVEDRANWIQSTCTCETWHKEYICKHVLLLAVRFGYVEIPLTAVTLDLCGMAKVGRPKKVGLALTRDPEDAPNDDEVDDDIVSTALPRAPTRSIIRAKPSSKSKEASSTQAAKRASSKQPASQPVELRATRSAATSQPAQTAKRAKRD